VLPAHLSARWARRRVKGRDWCGGRHGYGPRVPIGQAGGGLG